jgi:hypothetical protein
MRTIGKGYGVYSPARLTRMDARTAHCGGNGLRLAVP